MRNPTSMISVPGRKGAQEYVSGELLMPFTIGMLVR